MNSLSWMIYAADVAGGLGKCFGILGFVCLVVMVIWPVRNLWLDDFADGQGKGPAPKWLPVVGVGALVIASLIPAPTTIYAIAASEGGERVVNSETGGKAVKALNAWLDKQIASEDDAK